ncbi:hypothetical protein DB347_24430 [Opitutaceae bacterium EW11]|nr:hypothetical protein DB347_24430 [Opitutaceae bacterium EW11]
MTIRNILVGFVFVSQVHAAEPFFRAPFKLTLAVDKERYYEQQVDKLPYVHANVVYLFKGDRFGVRITSPNAPGLPEVTYEPDLIKADVVFSFSQEHADAKWMMMLKLESRLDKPLYMSALMTVPGKTGIYRTSILPLQPKLSNFESWPHPIVQLALKDFSFSAPSPNKSLQPTPTAVTPPAGAGVAPASGVAEH